MKIALIGAGNVGTTLALLLQQRGHDVAEIYSRTPASAARAVSLIPGSRPVPALTDLSLADIVIVATGDDALEKVAEDLTHVKAVHSGSIVFHCSGSRPAAILAALKSGGAKIASVHPVKTFTDPQGDAASFAGTWCGMEGDAAAVEVLGPLFASIGAHVFPLRGEDKMLYHAAIVFMCNDLFPLLEAGFACYEGSGVDRETAAKIAAPILHATIDNALRLGPSQALTGPVARGDAGVVAAQLAKLESFSADYAELYRVLGRLAADLSEQKGAASPDKIEEIRKILRK